MTHSHIAHTDLSQILTKNPKKTTLSKKTASNISEVIKFFTIQFRPYLLSTFMKIGTKLRHITYDCSILFNNMSKAKRTHPSTREYYSRMDRRLLSFPFLVFIKMFGMSRWKKKCRAGKFNKK